MTEAMILAGGVDPQFKSHIPKQFFLVDDLPVFVYTLTVFQNHPEIDGIYFVCLDGWQALVESYSRQFNITKLKSIITGGVSGQESACRGAAAMRGVCNDDDIVVVHDAIRPLVTDEIISDSIRSCKEVGMGVASITSMDAFMITNNRKTGYGAIDRSRLIRIQTPQTFRLGDLLDFCRQAEEKRIRNNMDVCTMISALGRDVNLSIGSEYNLKINRIEDIGLFKTLKDKKAADIP